MQDFDFDTALKYRDFWERYEELKNFESIHIFGELGDWNHSLSVRHAGRGYGTEFVHQANLQAINEEFGELLDYNGNIDLDMLRDMNSEEYESFRDTLKGLEDYPLVDDELHSQLETESHEEFFRDDFLPAVEKAVEEIFEEENREIPSEETIAESAGQEFEEAWSSGDLITEEAHSWLINFEDWVNKAVNRLK